MRGIAVAYPLIPNAFARWGDVAASSSRIFYRGSGKQNSGSSSIERSRANDPLPGSGQTGSSSRSLQGLSLLDNYLPHCMRNATVGYPTGYYLPQIIAKSFLA